MAAGSRRRKAIDRLRSGLLPYALDSRHFPITASSQGLFMPIINRVADFADEIAAWRRDFHENPELLFDVHRTAGIVADKLKAFGCDEVITGIGKTGVVGVIRGRQSA